MSQTFELTFAQQKGRVDEWWGNIGSIQNPGIGILEYALSKHPEAIQYFPTDKLSDEAIASAISRDYTTVRFLPTGSYALMKLCMMLDRRVKIYIPQPLQNELRSEELQERFDAMADSPHDRLQLLLDKESAIVNFYPEMSREDTLALAKEWICEYGLCSRPKNPFWTVTVHDGDVQDRQFSSFWHLVGENACRSDNEDDENEVAQLLFPYDHWAIKYIKNPTALQRVMAVQKYPELIRVINNPSEDLVALARSLGVDVYMPREETSPLLLAMCKQQDYKRLPAEFATFEQCERDLVLMSQPEWLPAIVETEDNQHYDSYSPTAMNAAIRKLVSSGQFDSIPNCVMDDETKMAIVKANHESCETMNFTEDQKLELFNVLGDEISSFHVGSFNTEKVQLRALVCPMSNTAWIDNFLEIREQPCSHRVKLFTIFRMPEAFNADMLDEEELEMHTMGTKINELFGTDRL